MQKNKSKINDSKTLKYQGEKITIAHIQVKLKYTKYIRKKIKKIKRSRVKSNKNSSR